MGIMKEFGLEIADLMYANYKSNHQIVKELLEKYPKLGEDWLYTQVKYIREHPLEWRGKAAYGGSIVAVHRKETQ